MTTKDKLIAIVKKANKEQIQKMTYDFNMIGFYNEDKRRTKSFIVNCIENSYDTYFDSFGINDSDSIWMEKSILKVV